MTNHTGSIRRRRDGGLPFVMVPVRLIGHVSPIALATYAAVSAYTNARTGTAWPGQVALAADLRVSVRTVQRALAELSTAGALQVEAAFREDGSQAENVYRITPLTPVEKGVDNPVD